MPERTPMDDVIDQAFEIMVSDELEGFTLIAQDGDELGVIEGTEDPDQALLNLFAHIEDIRETFARSGVDATIEEILSWTAEVAHDSGYVDDEDRRHTKKYVEF